MNWSQPFHALLALRSRAAVGTAPWVLDCGTLRSHRKTTLVQRFPVFFHLGPYRAFLTLAKSRAQLEFLGLRGTHLLPLPPLPDITLSLAGCDFLVDINFKCQSIPLLGSGLVT